MSLAPKSEDYIMVQAMHRPKTGSFTAAQIKRSLGSLPGITSTPASTSPNLAHGQTGTNASLVSVRRYRSCDMYVCLSVHIADTGIQVM